MRLAEMFHCLDVDQMLETMPSSKLTEWLLYFKIKNDEAESKRTRNTLKANVRKKRGR